jgi:type VI secretion system secreted protein VgrG
MQSARQIAVASPLGQDVFLFRRMVAKERLGRLFEFNLELLSEQDEIKLSDVLGKTMTVRLDLDDTNVRYFHGHVSRFGHVGWTQRHAVYRATVRPWLWFLTRTADCRIFQDMTVPDIIKQVFRDQGFSDFDEALSRDYRTVGYCVQYRETTFNFVSRLMEQEGIYYFFRHESDKHTLILSDSYGSHEKQPGYEEIPFYPPDEEARRERDFISDWVVFNEIQPGTYSLEEFDFERPRAGLEVRSSTPRDHAAADFEVYDYPGDYVETADGDTYARARIEEMQARYEQARGVGNARGLAVGSLFELVNHPRGDQNREYLLTSATHELEINPYDTVALASGPTYRCDFAAIDAKQPYRSQRITPKPVVQGPQTAIVVGPSGEEIWTDEYGRIKVQFHWDREGKNDENSSCWMRVSQNWGGKKWGGMFMPHIGHEVIVEFLEGDPDRPIVTGRVYNAVNMPPEDLPPACTQSIIRDHAGNEFIMEGADGSEKIELRDKYGNEMIFDAVAGTIRIHSPTHKSEIHLGKSIELFSESNFSFETLADYRKLVVGKEELKIGGDVLKFFAGYENKTIVGLTSKIIGGAKLTNIGGIEQKTIRGAKVEVIHGTVFKRHYGMEYDKPERESTEPAADNQGHQGSRQEQEGEGRRRDRDRRRRAEEGRRGEAPARSRRGVLQLEEGHRGAVQGGCPHQGCVENETRLRQENRQGQYGSLRGETAKAQGHDQTRIDRSSNAHRQSRREFPGGGLGCRKHRARPKERDLSGQGNVPSRVGRAGLARRRGTRSAEW